MNTYRGKAEEFGWVLLETKGRIQTWEKPDGTKWVHDTSRGALYLVKAPDFKFGDYNDPKEIDHT